MQQNNSVDNFNIKIKKYRTQIDKIDKNILSLLAQRQEEVSKVVALKKEHNIPVYHPSREEDLISRLRVSAANTGIDPDFLEDLYRIILRYSRISQTGQMTQKGINPGAKVLLIGGSGQMGQFFSTLFSGAGYEVRSLGETDWHRAPILCRDIDLVLICVPIDCTLETIERISPFLPPNAILSDITSIKKAPLDAMLKAHRGPVLGLHPLFGPTLKTLDKQIIIATPGRNDDHCRWLTDQFTLWGAVVVSSSAQEHDNIMEIVQALRHFATFCFGEFLSKRHVDLDKTLEFSSPIYRLELGMVGRLFAQDSRLYSEIIFSTPERRQLLKDYIISLNDHIDMLENNDKTLFIEKFKDIAQWFGPFSEQALRESTFLINKLIDRF